MTKKLKDYNLVTELKLLTEPSRPFTKIDYEDENAYKETLSSIINTLTSALADNPAHYCITGNQAGIPYNIGIVNVTKPIILINPKIEIPDDAIIIPYLECHINLQNRLFNTARYNHIIITADNLVDSLDLSFNNWNGDKITPQLYTYTQLMEIAFIQQAIDSMNGILPMQRQYIPIKKPIVNDSKIQRNQLCKVEKDGKTMEIKYKRLNKFIEEGWILSK